MILPWVWAFKIWRSIHHTPYQNTDMVVFIPDCPLRILSKDRVYHAYAVTSFLYIISDIWQPSGYAN